MEKLLIIGGPTAVGKSEVACCVAKRLGGEVVSADSMAVYRGMDVGTAKPWECLREVRHHLIDVVGPGEYFDAKIFADLATKAVEEIKGKGKVPVVVGGTYLYLQALLFGIEETPEPNRKLRERLYRIAEEKGKKYLYGKLKVVDPRYAEKVHENDLRRVVRALEVFVETWRPFSSFHRWGSPRFKFVGFFLSRSWENLSKRIELRVRRMVEEGLVEEVRRLVEGGFEGFLTSSQAIGYKELVPYLKGEESLERAVERIIRNTKEYAKRQLRWFRRQGWEEIDLDRVSEEEACAYVVMRYLSTPLSLSRPPQLPSPPSSRFSPRI